MATSYFNIICRTLSYHTTNQDNVTVLDAANLCSRSWSGVYWRWMYGCSPTGSACQDHILVYQHLMSRLWTLDKSACQKSVCVCVLLLYHISLALLFFHLLPLGPCSWFQHQDRLCVSWNKTTHYNSLWWNNKVKVALLNKHSSFHYSFIS